jgi:transketolase
MLLYASLHLSGYDLSLDEIRRFRQLGSLTPGHPEFRHTSGVETTTGPLGQGFANGVGMAMAERFLRERYGSEVVDHRVFAVCSDGDLMEGISSEAASIAGRLGLGRLVYLYDDNRITIDGSTDLYPGLAAEWRDGQAGKVGNGLAASLPVFDPAETPKLATRAASGKVFEAMSPFVPTMVGGAADLVGSTKTIFLGDDSYTLAAQAASYQQDVLLPGLPKISLEAASTFGWARWVEHAIGIDSFGASGPGGEVLTHFGIDPEAVADRVAAALGELAQL